MRTAIHRIIGREVQPAISEKTTQPWNQTLTHVMIKHTISQLEATCGGNKTPYLHGKF